MKFTSIRRASTMATLPVLSVLALGLSSMALNGCKEKGPMEKAGAKMDQAAQDAGKTIDKAVDETGKQMEEAGKAVQKAADGE